MEGVVEEVEVVVDIRKVVVVVVVDVKEEVDVRMYSIVCSEVILSKSYSHNVEGCLIVYIED